MSGFLLFLMVACKTDMPLGPDGPFEGDDPGECSDGADNDRDGDFDCDDSDCAMAPVCNGEPETDADTDADADSDTDVDADTDTDTSDCNDLCAGMESVTLQYEFALTVPVLGTCTMQFTGDGHVVSGHDDWVRFHGVWRRDSSNCSPTFDDVIWFNADGMGYHTFVFNPARTEISDWYVHRNSADYQTGTQRYFITELYTPMALSDPNPAFAYSVQDGDAFTGGNHHLSVTFTSR